MAGDLLEYMALAITYSVLAASLLDTLLWLWRVHDPPVAMRFRLLVLALPPLAPILFGQLDQLEAPGSFRQQMALLDLGNWFGPEFSLSHPMWMLLLIIMVATTTLLVTLEAVGFLRHALGSRGIPGLELSAPKKLQEAVARLNARGLHPPPVLVASQHEATAYAMGLRRPTIMMSAPLVDILDTEELEGVIVHEMAHIRRRDNWLAWLHLGLRLVSFYNPVALFVFHQISHDVERVCDAETAKNSGLALPLASALIKTYRASRPRARGSQEWPNRLTRKAASLETRAQRTLIEDRVERLIHSHESREVSYPDLRLALAASAVLGLAYLVV